MQTWNINVIRNFLTKRSYPNANQDHSTVPLYCNVTWTSSSSRTRVRGRKGEETKRAEIWRQTSNRGSIAATFRRRRLRRLAGLCLYICPAHGTVPPKRRRPRRRAETYSEISNIRTARREAGQMSTVLTAESARDVRLAWFHYKNVTHRAAPRRDATRRAAPRRVPRSRTVVDLSTMCSFTSLSLSLSLSFSVPVVVIAKLSTWSWNG